MSVAGDENDEEVVIEPRDSTALVLFCIGGFRGGHVFITLCHQDTPRDGPDTPVYHRNMPFFPFKPLSSILAFANLR
jgi:hypothetical protein